jgi:endonuclease YncB( thermonuclease family)
MRYLPLLLLLVLPVQAHVLLDEEDLFPATAETVYHGKVIKIADGDALTLLVDNPQLKIRLSEIDTPEQKQWDGLLLPLTASECQTGSAVTSQKREGVRDEDYAHWC